MKNTSISNDCPEFFANPERHPTVVAINRKKADDAYVVASNMHTTSTGHVKGLKRDPMESAYVLPGGESALARKPLHNTRYKTFAYNSRNNLGLTLLEPVFTERPLPPIQWKNPENTQSILSNYKK